MVIRATFVALTTQAEFTLLGAMIIILTVRVGGSACGKHEGCTKQKKFKYETACRAHGTHPSTGVI